MKLFKGAVFAQMALTFGHMMLFITRQGSGLWLVAISILLFSLSFIIMGTILHYSQNNDLFKEIKTLQDERDAYRRAKTKYLNAEIDRIESYKRSL